MSSYHFPGAIDMNDIDARNELNSMMNEITRIYFDFILVKCPDCACINARYSDNEIPCDSCKLPFQASNATDLFF